VSTLAVHGLASDGVADAATRGLARMEAVCGEQHDILDEMAAAHEMAFAGAMAPSAPAPTWKAGGVLVPSPRGIQDMLFDFPAASSDAGAEGGAGGGGRAGEAGADDKAAAHACCSPVKDEAALMPPAYRTAADFIPAESVPASPPPLLVVPPSAFTRNCITPWLDGAAQSSATTGMTLAEENEQSGGPQRQLPRTSAGVAKASSAPSKVMPPTAKSILERRERAIREGRRHEAKLNKEERRILRRLRNRESAERCAKRKNDQAEQLAGQIAQLERENLRLRSVAAQFETEVFKLEKYLLSQPPDQPQQQAARWTG
jgi:hypothetical protein